MKVMLNSETMLAEIALTEVRSRLVCTYRDLIELRSLPKTDAGDEQIALLTRHVEQLETELDRLLVLLKYDADLQEAMKAQCEHYADRLAVRV